MTKIIDPIGGYTKKKKIAAIPERVLTDRTKKQRLRIADSLAVVPGVGKPSRSKQTTTLLAIGWRLGGWRASGAVVAVVHCTILRQHMPLFFFFFLFFFFSFVILGAFLPSRQ